MTDVQHSVPIEVNHVETFRMLSQEISDYASSSGATVTAFHHRSLPLFTVLPVDFQASIIAELERLREFYSSYENEGWELNELKQLVWYAARRLGAHPPGGVMMDLIEDGDVIEIYDQDQAQIFRSFTHYNFCSYTIEELVSLHWSELYKRDDATNAVLAAAVQKAMNENVIVSNPAPTHTITECNSIRHYEMLYCLKHLVPLRVRGEKAPRYLMSIVKVELLSKSTSSEENLFENYLMARGRHL